MQKHFGNKFSDEFVRRHSGQTGQHLSNICVLSMLPDNVAQFGQGFIPGVSKHDSQASAKLAKWLSHQTGV